MIDAAGIRALLPHRYPMLLVDRVTECVPRQSLTAHKAVTGNEPWYADAPEDSDLRYPATLLMESWAQAAGVLATCSNAGPPGVMLLGSMSTVTFGAPVFPGHLVTHRVRVIRSFDDTVVCAGESTVEDGVAMTVRQAVLALRPAPRLRSATTEETT